MAQHRRIRCRPRRSSAGIAPRWCPEGLPAGSRPGRPSTTGGPTASSTPLPTQTALRSLEWLHRRENLIGCAPSGTGNTSLFEALGQQVVEQGLRAAWFALEDLDALRRHRADDTVTKAIARVLRADLAVGDDLGCSRSPTDPPKDSADGTTPPMRSARSRVTCPLRSGEPMSKTLATAAVDRLLRHTQVCRTSGDSARLTQALAGQR